jgi:hypothetical protein
MGIEPRGGNVPVSSFIASIVVLTASLIATIMISAAERPGPLIVASSIAAGIWIFMATRDRRNLAAAGASASKIAAATARYMGIVWLWGAVSLFVVYVFILTWHEWWQFFAAFAVVGAVCLGYAALLERDAAAGRDDKTMLALGRYMAIGQLVGMAVTVIGLAIDPDKELYWPADGDWAGNIIFMFGALALLAITAHALIDDKKPGTGARV